MMNPGYQSLADSSVDRFTHAMPTLGLADAEAMLCGYRSGIYSYIRRKGFSAEEADDLTQETLIRAYTHLDGFRGLSMGAWLYRIASNVSIDHLRKQRPVTVGLESFGFLDSGEEDPVERLHRDERYTALAVLIRQLAPCHQQVLRLRYLEDRSLEEIARQLDCSPMAAKLRVFRAVTALRKKCHATGVYAEMTAG
ncbi:MAG: RNA polymerase sigma factor [Armatimonadota bacterium]